jgi:hypothetical protein
VADPFDAMCRAAGRRILRDMTPEERAVNEQLGTLAPDLTDPLQVVEYVAASLMTESQTFNVTIGDIERRLKQLAWGSS